MEDVASNCLRTTASGHTVRLCHMPLPQSPSAAAELAACRPNEPCKNATTSILQKASETVGNIFSTNSLAGQDTHCNAWKGVFRMGPLPPIVHWLQSQHNLTCDTQLQPWTTCIEHTVSLRGTCAVGLPALVGVQHKPVRLKTMAVCGSRSLSCHEVMLNSMTDDTCT